MPNLDSNPPGSFCWMELGTRDQAAAKAFYAGLWGWTATDNDMGPGGVYTIFKLNGRDVSACYTQRKEDEAAGIPPNWLLYISTADVDASAVKAADLGGKILGGPFDVGPNGRMAVVQDPTGAVFSLWQAKSNPGVGVKDEPGAFCWADLMSPDVEKARKFYEGLFGWKVEAGEHDSSGYLHIKNGESFIGGMPPAEHQAPNAPPHWLLYYLVESCDESADKLKSLGGRILTGPMSIEKVGRMAIVSDPQGAAFSLFETARKS